MTDKLTKKDLLMIQGFIPPWLDSNDMCVCLPISPATLDNWVELGVLPAPVKRRGKLMWKWSEVDQKLTLGNVEGSPDALAERIRNGTKREATGRAGH